MKKEVTLHRRLPASAHLDGTAISIRVSARSNQFAEDAQQIKAILEADLLHHNNSLRVDDNHPDDVISCNILDESIPPPTRVQNQQTFSYEVRGSLDATYRAESTSGKVIDADTLAAKYSRDFDSTGSAQPSSFGEMFKGIKSVGRRPDDKDTMPTQAQVEHTLVQDVVAQIASRLVNTDEKVTVYLARGKDLDAANKFADGGLWDRMLEALDTMTPLPKPGEDAYRLYNIGVAYEALGYASSDAKAALKLFEEASINYGKALDADPKEKYFMEPQTRIETAVAIYKRLSEPPPATAPPVKENDGGQAAQKPTAPAQNQGGQSTQQPEATRALGPRSAPSADALTNEDIITLKRSGMDDADLIENIAKAPSVNFDISVKGQANLLKNGVSNRVVKAMRDRTSATH